jgi:hypothetical protein
MAKDQITKRVGRRMYMLKRNIKNVLLITLIIGGSFLCGIIVYAQVEVSKPPSQTTSDSTYEKDKASEAADSDSSVTAGTNTNSSIATNTATNSSTN